MTKQISENAANFLFYYLLGETLEDIENLEGEKVAFQCARRAYLDMSRTLKFKETYENKSEKEKKNILLHRKCFRDEICHLIGENILTFLQSESSLKKELFDEWHDETCLKIMEKAQQGDVLDIIENKYGNDQSFYYGQAQKWLNMTIKYMRITGKWEEEMAPIVSVLHIPVDSYIIQGVWEHKGWEDVLEKVIVDNKEKTGTFLSDKVVPWSKWNKEQYKNFQEKLRTKFEDKEAPIMWEEKTWIDIAKSRANED